MSRAGRLPQRLIPRPFAPFRCFHCERPVQPGEWTTIGAVPVRSCRALECAEAAIRERERFAHEGRSAAGPHTPAAGAAGRGPVLRQGYGGSGR